MYGSGVMQNNSALCIQMQNNNSNFYFECIYNKEVIFVKFTSRKSMLIGLGWGKKGEGAIFMSSTFKEGRIKGRNVGQG